MTDQNSTLQIVGPKDQFSEDTLIAPAKSEYLMLALEVDHRPPIGFFLQSRRKTRLIRDLKVLAQKLRDGSNVLDSTVFKALIVPPGLGAFLNKRPQIEIARFDVVLLVEFVDVQSANDFTAITQWMETLASAEKLAHKSIKIVASNVRRIGPVDHSGNGVFLFNYFYADSLNANLDVWNYTAGWFHDQTGLDNSTVLLPEHAPDISYTIINHCRWDRLRDILPAILFNKTFRSFVLANFKKNSTAAMPVLYRLA